MRIRGITVAEIAAGGNWVIVDSGPDSQLDWEAKPCRHASSRNAVLHSAAFVFRRICYPCLTVNYYADGVMHADSLYWVNGGWRESDDVLLGGDRHAEGPILARPSALDHEVYQRGQFDYRPEHRSRFRELARQFGRRVPPTPPEALPPVPQRLLRLPVPELIKELIHGIEAPWGMPVAKGNRIAMRTAALLAWIKRSREGREALLTLLEHGSRQIRAYVAYGAMDFARESALAALRNVARGDDLIAMAARMNLGDLDSPRTPPE
jgi:hypothetical protein